MNKGKSNSLKKIWKQYFIHENNKDISHILSLGLNNSFFVEQWGSLSCFFVLLGTEFKLIVNVLPILRKNNKVHIFVMKILF